MKWLRYILWILGVIFLLLLLLRIANSPTPVGATMTYLPFGWWLFLKENIPQMSVNWSLVSTGVVCSALVLVLVHSFLGVLYEQIQVRSRPGEPARKWRWRWSACLYASIWLLFLIAFGSAGVLRHTTWLLNYNQPWYEARGRSHMKLDGAGTALVDILLDADEDFEKTRQAVLADQRYMFGGTNPLFEDFNVILYGDSNNKVATYLIIPRNEEALSERNFAVFVPGQSRLFRPVSELPQLLVKMDATYPIKVSQ